MRLIVPARLGSRRPYTSGPARPPRCVRLGGRARAADEHTRPYDSGRRLAGMPPRSGFYLDLLTDELDGSPPPERSAARRPQVRAPVYYDLERAPVDGSPGLRISYWKLYGSDGPRTAPPDREALFGHEGDWERVTVLLQSADRPDRYRPVAVRYHRESGDELVAWGDVARVAGGRGGAATHPLILAARGSHSPYPREGTVDMRMRTGDGPAVTVRDDAVDCGHCPEWRTWERLRPVREEPWYGYGGGWGLAYQGDERSGPLGPSPFLR